MILRHHSLLYVPMNSTLYMEVICFSQQKVALLCFSQLAGLSTHFPLNEDANEESFMVVPLDSTKFSTEFSLCLNGR